MRGCGNGFEGYRICCFSRYIGRYFRVFKFFKGGFGIYKYGGWNEEFIE